MRKLKLFICTYSGNVGKSTLSKQFFKAMMPGESHVYHIETINHVSGDKVSPKKINDVLVDIDLYDNAIVDVGSTNLEQVFEKAKGIQGFAGMFDYFVVVAEVGKQQHDAVRTIMELIDMLDVPASKIRVIYNKFAGDLDDYSIVNVAIEACSIPHSPALIKYDDLFLELQDMYIRDVELSDSDLISIQTEIDAETDKDKKRALLTKKLYANRVVGLLKTLKITYDHLNLA